MVRPPASTPARAVVFDLDDTLFDHTGSVRRALVRWLPTMGATAGPALVRAWFELEERQFAAWRAGTISFAEQRRRRLRDFLPLVGRRVGGDRELDDVFSGYLHWYEASWQTFDDVRPVLDVLSARRVVVAVLTNGAAAQQQAKVEALGIGDDIAALLTSEELGVAKPAPQAYLGACDRLQVDPDQALHVGDRHDLDVVAARAAGLHALHLDRHHQHAEPPEGRITSLVELVDRLSLT